MAHVHREILCVVLLTVIAVCAVQAQDPSTTPSPEIECALGNKSCEDCVKNAACLWCDTRPDKCSPYPVGQVIPSKEYCDLSDARWGVCWLNYKALLITMGVIASIIVLSVTCCCVYCCCCRNKKKQRRKYMEEEAKYEAERTERQAKHEERKQERQSKYDDIRKKYGIVKDDNPYQRFDE